MGLFVVIAICLVLTLVCLSFLPVWARVLLSVVGFGLCVVWGALIDSIAKAGAGKQWGLALDQIAAEYGVPEAQVRDALAFYQDHSAEIDAAIASEQVLDRQHA